MDFSQTLPKTKMLTPLTAARAAFAVELGANMRADLNKSHFQLAQTQAITATRLEEEWQEDEALQRSLPWDLPARVGDVEIADPPAGLGLSQLAPTPFTPITEMHIMAELSSSHKDENFTPIPLSIAGTWNN